MHVESTLNPIFLCLAGSSEERGPGPSGQTDGADFPHRWVSLVHRSMLYVDPETPPPPPLFYILRDANIFPLRIPLPLVQPLLHSFHPLNSIIPFALLSSLFCSNFPLFSLLAFHTPPPPKWHWVISPHPGAGRGVFSNIYVHPWPCVQFMNSH